MFYTYLQSKLFQSVIPVAQQKCQSYHRLQESLFRFHVNSKLIEALQQEFQSKFGHLKGCKILVKISLNLHTCLLTLLDLKSQDKVLQ